MFLFKKTMLCVAIMLMTSSVFIWANGSSEEDAMMKEVTFSFAHNHTEQGMYHIGALKFKELVEARSDGQITIDIFPNGQLGADSEIQEGVEIGTIDMGISSSPVAGINEYAKLLDAPYLFVNRDHVTDVFDGPLGEKIASPLAEKNIIQLGFWENGFRQITNNVKPINVPADLAGLKLRTPNNAVRVQTFKTFGASPTPMSFSEVFGALQTGVIDGQENPLAVINQASLFEVQEYLSISNHVYSVANLLMNKNKFDALDPKHQKILQDAGAEAAKYTRQVGADSDANLAGELEGKGMKVNNVNTAAFIEAGKAVWTDIVSSNEMSDAQAVLDEIAETGEKYLQ